MCFYDYELFFGIYWMYVYILFQEMNLFVVLLIVCSVEDVVVDCQEVVMFFYDFLFKVFEEVMQEIIGGYGGGYDMSVMGGYVVFGVLMDYLGMQMDMFLMQGMVMDLNDYNWDVYLINDCILFDLEIIMVEKGGWVKLWVINGVLVIVFWIDMGGLFVRFVVVDGYVIVGFEGSCFGIVMG